jgi:glycosyltransferase involved in cell wall biosynthesis
MNITPLEIFPPMHLISDVSPNADTRYERQRNPAAKIMRGQVVAMLLDCTTQTWGSREEMHLRFSQALISRGVRPVLVFSEDIPQELRNKYEAHGVEVAPAINYEKGIFNYYREIGKVVKTHSVTAVHIAFFNYFSLMPWLARLRGVRYIVYHERNPGVIRAKSWKRRLLQLRGRLATLPVTRVAAISQFIKEQLVEVGVPERKISLVYNGVDARRYLPDPTAKEQLTKTFCIRQEEMILATLCYLKPHKNIDVVIEACQQLAKRGVACRLLVIGEGSMRREWEALAEKLGIADRIHWLGHVPDPIPILQGCDVFLMVSMGEGFGLALAEAMACGTAVVAARSGALSEIVEDGMSGLLVPPRDAAALADAIEKLAKDENLRRQMAERAMERVRRHFTVEASIEKMMNVYESIWS